MDDDTGDRLTQEDSHILTQLINRNGWRWVMVQTVAPKTYGITITGIDLDENYYRRVITGTHFYQALEDAEKFVETITPEEYFNIEPEEDNENVER